MKFATYLAPDYLDLGILEESNQLINEISKKNGFVFFQFLLGKNGKTSLPYVTDGLEYMTFVSAESGKDLLDPFHRSIHKQDISSRKENEEKLLLQKERLKEIAWIESHVVRSPLSNTLGLLPLFDKEKVGSSENLDLLSKLEEVTKKLDEVIREVVKEATKICEINKIKDW